MEDIPLDESDGPRSPTDASLDQFELVSPRDSSINANPVARWLSSLDLSEYTSIFLEQGFDRLSVLPQITDDHLRDMGVRPGHRLAILAACEQSDDANSSAFITSNESFHTSQDDIDDLPSTFSTEAQNDRIFLDALVHRPIDYRPHAAYAKYLFQCGRNRRSKIHCQRALELILANPSKPSDGPEAPRPDPDAIKTLEEISYLLGRLYHADGLMGFANARFHLLKCVELNPNHFDAHHLLGVIEFAVGLEARTFGSKNIPMRPTVSTIVVTTKTYECGRWFESASFHFQEAITRYTRTQLPKPKEDLTESKVEPSRVESRDASSSHPRMYGFADAHYNLGLVLIERRQFASAERNLRCAITIDPFFNSARLQLAKLQIDHLQRYDDAEEILLKAISMDKFMKDWESHLMYGNLLHRHLQNYDDAYREFKLTLDIHPHCAEAHFRLGHLLKNQLLKDDEAEVHFQKGLEIDPQNSARFDYYQHKVTKFASSFLNSVASALDTAVDSVRTTSASTTMHVGEVFARPLSSRDRSGSLGDTPPPMQ